MNMVMPPHASFGPTLRAGELNGIPMEPLLARCLSLSLNRPLLGSSSGPLTTILFRNTTDCVEPALLVFPYPQGC